MSANSNIIIATTLEDSLLNFRLPLLLELIRRQIPITTIAASADEMAGITGKNVDSELKSLGIDHRKISIERIETNPLNDLTTLSHFITEFREIKPTHFVAYTAKAVIYGLLAAWICRIPRRIAYITGLFYGLGEPPRKGRTPYYIARWLARFAIRRANLVICQNPDDVAALRQGGFTRPATPTEIVNGSGVDCTHFAKSPLPEGPITFLMIARLLEDKGVREYFEASRLVKTSHPECRFILAGPLDGRPGSITESEIRAWERETQGIWHGPVADVRPLLRECHIFVLPSYHEGTPRTVLEAMATGRAILTTDAPGCRETVIPGHNGKLVPPKDAAALATAMGSMFQENHTLSVMAERARALAVRSYEARAVAEATADLILGGE